MLAHHDEVERLNRCIEQGRACMLLLRATKAGSDVIAGVERTCHACENLAHALMEQTPNPREQCMRALEALNFSRTSMAPLTLYYCGQFANECAACIRLCESLMLSNDAVA